MTPIHKLSRRSFLATVAGMVAAAGAITVAATDPAEAFQGDTDSGPNADPPGRGRYHRYRGYRGYRSGCTDNDSGPYSDRRGNGRCRRRYYRRPCTDTDSGRYGDSPGHGRRC